MYAAHTPANAVFHQTNHVSGNGISDGNRHGDAVRLPVRRTVMLTNGMPHIYN